MASTTTTSLSGSGSLHGNETTIATATGGATTGTTAITSSNQNEIDITIDNPMCVELDR